jgi:class 3 adenylate cyclase
MIIPYPSSFRMDKVETEERGGYVFNTVGDAFCCAFWTATDALDAALEVQRTLFDEEWQETGSLRVRMALHTGAAEERDGDYFGPPVNRATRLWGAAQALHETKGIPRDIDFFAEADARISAVRSGMGEEVWEEAWRKGRAMTLDEAISYAMEEEEASG